MRRLGPGQEKHTCKEDGKNGHDQKRQPGKPNDDRPVYSAHVQAQGAGRNEYAQGRSILAAV